MKNANQLKAGTMLTYINLAISCIIPLFYTPIMLQILGQEDYGVYALSNSVSGYLTMLSFGIGTAIIRYVTKYRAQGKDDDVRRVMGLFMTIYFFLALLVLICGTVLIASADTLFGKGLTAGEIINLRWLLVLMTVSTAVSFPLSVYSSIVVAYENYIPYKLVHIVETIATPAVSLVLLYLGAGNIGLAALGLPTQIISACFFGVYARKKLNMYPVFKNMPVGIMKELISFCAFIFLSSIVDMLYWSTDKALIGALIGSTAVAVYNVGGTFTSIFQSMAHAISGVFSPRVNLMVANNAPKKDISELLIRIGRLQYLLISLTLSGYVVFGQAFIHFWAGDEYMEAYYIALLTMVPISVPLIQSIAFATILAENKHRFRSIVYAIIAVVNVISTYLVLPYYGIIGAAVCTAISFVLGQCIIMNIYYHRVTKLDIPAFWKNIAQMSLVPIFLVVLGLFLVKAVLPMGSIWWFLFWVVAYTIVFAVLSWLITMNRYEKDLILGLVKKVLPIKKRA